MRASGRLFEDGNKALGSTKKGKFLPVQVHYPRTCSAGHATFNYFGPQND